MIILWIILGIVYLSIAFCFIRLLSYSCVMGAYGVYHYSLWSILVGLFFPIYIVVVGIFELVRLFRKGAGK